MTQGNCSHCGFPLPASGGGLRHYGTHTAHSENECLRLLHAEIGALRKDAARYAWMCSHRLGWFSRMAPIPWGRQSMKDALDAAIDAAMKAQP